MAALALLVFPLEIRGWSLSWEAVLLVLAVPVAEEAFFRGTLLRLSTRRPVLLAAVSALCFGALHWKLGGVMMVAMAALGAGLAALALVSRSVALPTIVHAVFNGLAVGYRERALSGVLLALAGAGVVAAAGWIVHRRSR